MEYLKQFVIGSCAFAIIPWFYLVYNLKQKKNYSYFTFTLSSPISLGLWNVASLIIAQYFGFTNRMRYIVISIIHWILTILLVQYLKLYNYSNKEWNKYYIGLLIKYFIHWNVVIFLLDKYI
jgi:hypothetical protein